MLLYVWLFIKYYLMLVQLSVTSVVAASAIIHHNKAPTPLCFRLPLRLFTRCNPGGSNGAIIQFAFAFSVPEFVEHFNSVIGDLNGILRATNLG